MQHYLADVLVVISNRQWVKANHAKQCQHFGHKVVNTTRKGLRGLAPLLSQIMDNNLKYF